MMQKRKHKRDTRQWEYDSRSFFVDMV